MALTSMEQLFIERPLYRGFLHNDQLVILFPVTSVKKLSAMLSAPTRVEFLFRVLLGIGVLFRVGTPYSSIPLRITLRSCQGET